MKQFLKVLRNQKGMNLTELLIAAGIIVIVAAMTGTIVFNNARTAKKLEQTAACRPRMLELLQQFKNIDNRSRIDAWHPTEVAGNATLPTDFVAFSNNPAKYFSLPYFDTTKIGSGISSSNLNTADQYKIARFTNAWMNIYGGASAAAALYNQGGYCDATANAKGHQLAVGEFGYPASAGSRSLPNEKLYINIRRFDAKTNSANCSHQGTTSAAPIGGNINSKLSSNYFDPEQLQEFESMQVLATVTFDETQSDGTLIERICQDEVQLKYDVDINPPAVSPIEISYTQNAPSRVYLPSNRRLGETKDNTLCVSSGDSADQRSLDFSLATNKPGSLFFCKLEYHAPNGVYANYAENPSDPTTKWVPCAPTFSFSAGGNTIEGHALQTGLGIGANGFLRIRVRNLAEGSYTLSVFAVDYARNASPPVSIGFGVDTTRPNTAPTPAPETNEYVHTMSATGPFINGHQDFTAKAAPLNINTASVAGSFGTTLFQCIPDNSYNWKVEWTSQPNVISPPALQWAFDNVATGTWKFAKLDQPIPYDLQADKRPTTPDGTHSVKIYNTDECAVVTNTATIASAAQTTPPKTWVVDTGQVTSSHSGASFNQINNNLKITTEGFQMGTAKANDVGPYATHPATLPYSYVCEDSLTHNYSYMNSALPYLGNPALQGSTQHCKQPSISRSCKMQSSDADGFCTAAFDGCGRFDQSPPKKYEVYGKAGEECGEVDCEPNIPLYCDKKGAGMGICKTTPEWTNPFFPRCEGRSGDCDNNVQDGMSCVGWAHYCSCITMNSYNSSCNIDGGAFGNGTGVCTCKKSMPWPLPDLIEPGNCKVQTMGTCTFPTNTKSGSPLNNLACPTINKLCPGVLPCAVCNTGTFACVDSPGMCCRRGRPPICCRQPDWRGGCAGDPICDVTERVVGPQKNCGSSPTPPPAPSPSPTPTPTPTPPQTYANIQITPAYAAPATSSITSDQSFTFTVKNTGDRKTSAMKAFLREATSAPDPEVYKITANTCDGKILNPNDTCQVDVKFIAKRARAKGYLTAQLALDCYDSTAYRCYNWSTVEVNYNGTLEAVPETATCADQGRTQFADRNTCMATAWWCSMVNGGTTSSSPHCGVPCAYELVAGWCYMQCGPGQTRDGLGICCDNANYDAALRKCNYW